MCQVNLHDYVGVLIFSFLRSNMCIRNLCAAGEIRVILFIWNVSSYEFINNRAFENAVE